MPNRFSASDVPMLVERGGQRIGLAPQTIKIMKLVADGAGSREAANKIGITRHVVDDYIAHAFKRYSVNSRIQLVVMCLLAGIDDE